MKKHLGSHLEVGDDFSENLKCHGGSDGVAGDEAHALDPVRYLMHQADGVQQARQEKQPEVPLCACRVRPRHDVEWAQEDEERDVLYVI